MNAIHRRAIAVWLLALLVGPTGCPRRVGPVGAPPDPNERAAGRLLDEARRALARGERSAGLRLLSDAARRYPETVAADEARLNLGIAALEAGELEEAERRLRALRQRPLKDPGIAARWHRAMVRLGRETARPRLTITHLDALVEAGGADESERLALADLLLGDGEPQRAWRVLRDAARTGTGAAGRRRLREILAKRSDAELAALAPVADPGTAEGGMVRLLDARRLLSAGEVDGAARRAEEIAPASLDPEDGRALEELLAEIERRRSVDPIAIGLLLPLSGPFAKVGAQARAAVELALGELGVGPRLVVIDTQGTPEGAARGMEALVTEHQVVAALGPVGYQEAGAAAGLAEDYAIPLIALSSRADLTTGRQWVIRTFASRPAQAQAIARWAVLRYGTRRLAILSAETSYGAELAAAFRAEVERLGGAIVASASYRSRSEDLREPLGRLLGRRVPPADDLGLDELGFEALFIADTARGVRRVVPYLHFARVPIRTHPARAGILLLGAGGWNHPSIIDPAEGLTNNAVFSATFLPNMEDTVVGSFMRRFLAAHGVPPTPFQAEVYDTAKMLFTVHASLDAPDRMTLRQALASVGNWVGVTGAWTVLPNGRVRRTLPVLTIDGELIRPRRSEEEERELRGAGGAPAF